MTKREMAKQLKDKLQPKIDAVLTKNVFSTVKRAEIVAIATEVYGIYDPTDYERRLDKVGMLDPKNVKISGGKAQGGRLVVYNDTPPNPYGVSDGAASFVTTDKSLPELIEFGHKKYTSYSGCKGYDWPRARLPYYRPRPFTKETVRILSDGGYCNKQMKRGLKEQGVRVK